MPTIIAIVSPTMITIDSQTIAAIIRPTIIVIVSPTIAALFSPAVVVIVNPTIIAIVTIGTILYVAIQHQHCCHSMSNRCYHGQSTHCHNRSNQSGWSQCCQLHFHQDLAQILDVLPIPRLHIQPPAEKYPFHFPRTNSIHWEDKPCFCQ